MAKTTGSARALCVWQILKEFSDKDNPLSANEIIEFLEERGICAERKSIYRDIENIRDLGYEVEAVATPKRGYYLAGREFEVPEVCLLIDAVQSAGFITDKKTRELVGKLESLVSKNSLSFMQNRICIENRSKAINESVYSIINVLNEAISKRRKVKIRYRKYILNNTTLDYSYKDMIINPYALLWDSDHYYLIGNNTKYDNLTNLRVDRIEKAELTKEPFRHFSEVCEYKQRFDTADYARKVFNMFGGKLCKIDLECNLSLLDQMIDKFGDKIFIRHFGNDDTFRFTTDAAVSEGLVGWLMQFGSDVKVLSPSELKQAVFERGDKIKNLYNEKV